MTDDRAHMVENLLVAGLSLVQSLAGGFLTTSNHANQELYEKAQAELVQCLAKSASLSSQLTFSLRHTVDMGHKAVLSQLSDPD
jgi:hypothetical protein